jgi:hypothetical protein
MNTYFTNTNTTSGFNPTTIANAIRDLADKFRPPPPPKRERKIIVCHPVNMPLLKMADDFGQKNGLLTGMPVRASDAVPLRARRWEFPKDRFVEYEKSDEKWAIPLGFGKWVDDGPWFAVVDLDVFEPPPLRVYFDHGLMPLTAQLPYAIT